MIQSRLSSVWIVLVVAIGFLLLLVVVVVLVAVGPSVIGLNNDFH